MGPAVKHLHAAAATTLQSSLTIKVDGYLKLITLSISINRKPVPLFFPNLLFTGGSHKDPSGLRFHGLDLCSLTYECTGKRH